MKRVLIYSLLAFGVLSCSKDNFETKPHIEYKSSNTDYVPIGSGLRITLNYTDKEGDIDSAYIIRKRLNRKSQITANTLPYKVPYHNKSTQGELEFTLDYYSDITVNIVPPIPIPGSGGKFEPDTLEMNFLVVDEKKNISDTTKHVFIVAR